MHLHLDSCRHIASVHTPPQGGDTQPSATAVENGKVIRALEAFAKHRKSDTLWGECKGVCYGGRFLLASLVVAKHQRHAVFEAYCKLSGERKWLRFVWMHPTHPRLTLREFHILRSTARDSVSCFPTLDSTTIEGSFLVAVYAGLPAGAHPLSRELAGTGKGDSKRTLCGSSSSGEGGFFS